MFEGVKYSAKVDAIYTLKTEDARIRFVFTGLDAFALSKGCYMFSKDNSVALTKKLYEEMYFY